MTKICPKSTTKELKESLRKLKRSRSVGYLFGSNWIFWNIYSKTYSVWTALLIGVFGVSVTVDAVWPASCSDEAVDKVELLLGLVIGCCGDVASDDRVPDDEVIDVVIPEEDDVMEELIFVLLPKVLGGFDGPTSACNVFKKEKAMLIIIILQYNMILINY